MSLYVPWTPALGSPRLGARLRMCLLLLGLTMRSEAAGTTAGTTNDLYATYGGSGSCQGCHAAEYRDWEHSHHALAERNPEATQEDPAFIPARSVHIGTQQTSFCTNAGRYELISAGLRGSNETYLVQRILGENPLRQMLIAFPGGRIQASEVAWDPRSNVWFDVYGEEDRKPGEWGNWLGRGMNWNSQCAVCHNTRLNKNYDAATDTYQTAMVEHGVGCESCHGPMAAHNQWQLAHQHQSLKDPTLTVLTRDQMTETCAGCHSRRGEMTDAPAPGASFWDHYLLATVDDSELFYPDGQIHDEDYEFTAFLGSAMYNHGVRCVDCHNPHTMKTKLPGNLLCLSCHAPGSKQAPPIDPVRHGHHPVFGFDAKGVLTNTDVKAYAPAREQAGGECVNCHMPQTVYMQRHWRHDHGFTIPDPRLTKEFGIPNACNRCHTDQTTDWSLGYVEQWYGTNMNRPYRQRAETIARARRDDPEAIAPLLRMLQADPYPYWRAAAANLLRPWAGETNVTPALTKALSDPHPLVRQASVEALGPPGAAGRDDITAALRPALTDASRNVRIAAARQLAATLDVHSRAGQEYLRFLERAADQPLGQVQLGDFAAHHGELTNALVHFQTAVQWDPYSAGIRHELAIVLSQLGRSGDAVSQLETAIKLEPQNAQFHYDLALACNEAGETERVVPELEAAVNRDPQFARAWYNLGLARSGRGDDAGALTALIRAESADPNDAQIPYARATVLARQGDLAGARNAAQRALELNPNFPAAADLLRQLNGQ